MGLPLFYPEPVLENLGEGGKLGIPCFRNFVGGLSKPNIGFLREAYLSSPLDDYQKHLTETTAETRHVNKSL